MTIGIGVLGLSHWYIGIGTAYQVCLHPDAELIAFAHPDSDYVEQAAKTYRARRWYVDYNELISDPDIDAIIITTTTQVQPQVATDAARAGKHLLLCKPLARTLKEADNLLNIVREFGIVLVAAASRPLNEDPVKEAIQDGVIGVPYALHLSLHAIEPYSAPGEPDPGWFIDPNQAAGGAFIDHAIYDVAAARWYLEDEVTKVSGVIKNIKHPDWQVEDYGLALLKFSNGGIATIESTFLGHYQTRSHKSILGTEGRIEWIDDQVYVFTKDPKKETHKAINFLEGKNPVFSDTFLSVGIPEPPFTWHYAPMVLEFIECIKSGKAPIQSGEHARTNLEICLGAYQSAAENREVNLPVEECPDIVELLNKLIH